MDFYVVKDIVEGNEQKLMELFIKTQNNLVDSGADKKELASFRLEVSTSWSIIENMIENSKTVEDLIFVNSTICEMASIMID